MRTRPSTRAPLAAITAALSPGLMRATSALVASARHSRRPPRIILNSSAPLPTTAPTVAVRAEITPVSGASNWVCVKRSCCTLRAARVASSLALAVLASVRYWLICWSLSAPLACRVRAFSALPLASSALASASARLALAWATSARPRSLANVASTWPLRTRSPTLAFTSSSLRPSDSLLMMASCHAAMLPLADRAMGKLRATALSVLTVSAAFGGAAALSSLGLFVK